MKRALVWTSVLRPGGWFYWGMGFRRGGVYPPPPNRSLMCSPPLPPIPPFSFHRPDCRPPVPSYSVLRVIPFFLCRKRKVISLLSFFLDKFPQPPLSALRTLGSDCFTSFPLGPHRIPNPQTSEQRDSVIGVCYEYSISFFVVFHFA